MVVRPSEAKQAGDVGGPGDAPMVDRPSGAEPGVAPTEGTAGRKSSGPPEKKARTRGGKAKSVESLAKAIAPALEKAHASVAVAAAGAGRDWVGSGVGGLEAFTAKEMGPLWDPITQTQFNSTLLGAKTYKDFVANCYERYQGESQRFDPDWAGPLRPGR